MLLGLFFHSSRGMVKPSNQGDSMKRAVLYLRVSTTDQTTANQERELRQVADRMGREIVHVYKDHGISGAKGGQAAGVRCSHQGRQSAQVRCDHGLVG